MKHLISTAEVCHAYGISRSTLWRRIKAGQIPTPTKINDRNYWLADAINEHIESVIGGAA
ncbi:helix-turn-helix transcriptional regulator [Vibrio mediterranei]|uniref:helix-turn-helix transcriptional regulator n=1 Tax=Vibrio TaxID=662 RepID=UPI004067B930